MSLPAQFHGLDGVPLPPRPLHLAIGMFDGVHLGHQAVIESAVHSARRSGGLAGVLTFWPHPSRVFAPTEPVRMLMSPEMKFRVLLRLGVDAVIEQPFTPAFARITAEEFLPHLQQRLPQRRCHKSLRPDNTAARSTSNAKCSSSAPAPVAIRQLSAALISASRLSSSSATRRSAASA